MSQATRVATTVDSVTVAFDESRMALQQLPDNASGVLMGPEYFTVLVKEADVILTRV